MGEGTLMKKDKQLLQKANSIQRSMWCTSCGVRTATLIRDRTMMENFLVIEGESLRWNGLSDRQEEEKILFQSNNFILEILQYRIMTIMRFGT